MNVNPASGNGGAYVGEEVYICIVNNESLRPNEVAPAGTALIAEFAPPKRWIWTHQFCRSVVRLRQQPQISQELTKFVERPVEVRVLTKAFTAFAVRGEEAGTINDLA